MPPGDQENTEQRQLSQEQKAWVDRFAEVAFVALPVSTVVVIALAIFVVGAPRSYRAARVWGGPTTSQDVVSLTVQVFDRLGEVERPVPSVPLQLTLSSGGRSVHWQGSSDARGFAHPRLALKTGDRSVDLDIRQGRLSLARGSVRISSSEWKRGVTREGGWTRARQKEPFSIRVSPARGVFAVPFADPLLVEVREATRPVVGARLSFRPSGVRIESPEEPVLTDERGRARVLISPIEHHPTLGIEASYEGRHGRWHSSLPVVPGAMHARLQGERLLIRSPVAREEAFYSVVSERGRLAGGRVVLAADGRGGSQALVSLPPKAKQPLWAVLSSEPDLQSPAAVGWPLSEESVPARTFDVHDRLWLDGAPAGYARNQRTYRQARWLAAGYAVLALALVSLLLLVRIRKADQRLTRHLAAQSPSTERPPAARRFGFAVVVALLCVALGFVLVLLLAVYRIGVP